MTPPTTLRLVGYNIRSALHHPRGVDALADAVRELRPDVLSLQEVDRGTRRSGGRDQTAEIARRLDLPHHVFGPATPWPGGGEYGVALLSRHPLEDALTTPLYVPTGAEFPESEREPRTLLSATLRLPAGAARVFATHFGLASDQRRVQARETAAAVEQAALFLPPLLIGDLIAPPDAPELAPLWRHLRDAHAGLARSERGTAPSGVPLGEAAITDYVLVPRGAAVREARVVPDTAEASDHNLVLAVVELP